MLQMCASVTELCKNVLEIKFGFGISVLAEVTGKTEFDFRSQWN